MNIIVGALLVFSVFGLMSMAGLGAATLFIPIFHYASMPLPEAISTGPLLNIVSLGFAVPSHVLAGLRGRGQGPRRRPDGRTPR